MADSPLFVDDDDFSHLLDEIDDLDSPAAEPTNDPFAALESKIWDNSDEAQQEIMSAAKTSGFATVRLGQETIRNTASNCTGEEDNQRASALVYSASRSNDD
ncbi:hypothetical protein F5Y05DRAFT_411462 [Hypoxylon sp. FL0543]|nr:hypothetical protein F5Y05DRAFT_411462 [Hypoxylon sp. FL0543]